MGVKCGNPNCKCASGERLILQIGQLFTDLVRLGDLLQKLAGDKRSAFARRYGNPANFAQSLLESLRNMPLDLDDLPWGEGTFQIHLANTG